MGSTQMKNGRAKRKRKETVRRKDEEILHVNEECGGRGDKVRKKKDEKERKQETRTATTKSVSLISRTVRTSFSCFPSRTK